MRVFSLLLLFIVGCAPSANTLMNAWTGRHMSELVEGWGAPAQVFKDEADGGVLVYAHTGDAAPPEAAPGTQASAEAYAFREFDRAASAATYDPSQVDEGGSRLFWVNAEGYIYMWARRGE